MKLPAILTPIVVLYQNVRDIARLFAETVFYTFTPPYRLRPILDQIYWIGVNSTAIVLSTIAFVGMISIVELSFQMDTVLHTTEFVPGFATVLILREFASVIPAAMMAGKVGAGITAEIGSMQLTEQVDALRLISINPVRHLVVPRFVASVLSLMMLSCIAAVVAIITGMIVCSISLDIDWLLFINSARNFVKPIDLGINVFKAFIFGMIIPVVASYYGFRTTGGAEGVGIACTKSVVYSGLVIVILDFFMTWVASVYIL